MIYDMVRGFWYISFSLRKKNVFLKRVKIREIQVHTSISQVPRWFWFFKPSILKRIGMMVVPCEYLAITNKLNPTVRFEHRGFQFDLRALFKYFLIWAFFWSSKYKQKHFFSNILSFEEEETTDLYPRHCIVQCYLFCKKIWFSLIFDIL